jgi:hypothetical protein
MVALNMTPGFIFFAAIYFNPITLAAFFTSTGTTIGFGALFNTH